MRECGDAYTVFDAAFQQIPTGFQQNCRNGEQSLRASVLFVAAQPER